MTQGRVPQREVNLARELSKAGLKLVEFSNALLAQDAEQRPASHDDLAKIQKVIVDVFVYVVTYLTKYGRKL